jgi:membrane associated rhomboid family serine protease
MSYQQYRPSQFKLLPDAVKNLLIINGLFFLATYVLSEKFGINLELKLGLFYFESEFFRPYQLVTHLFMHGSMMHIFSNMFSLWMFGTALENYWGPKRFLIYYFATGLGAALIHSLASGYDIYMLRDTIHAFNDSPSLESFIHFTRDKVPLAYQSSFMELSSAWESHPLQNNEFIANANQLMNQLLTLKINIPTVGASGAVFGVLLAFGMLFPNNVIYIYFAIPLKAKYFVILYGLFELYNGFQNNPQDNVAHFAHLGGMLFGFLLIKYWNRHSKHFY